MVADAIAVFGARQNNLKGISLTVPKGRLVAITGPSGAGKSSLALEILYAEGQRRYVETFSPYARQFFERLDPPAVDAVTGVLPAVALEAGGTVRTARATVGTLTEIDDLVKVIWAQAATWHCPACGVAARSFPDGLAAACWFIDKGGMTAERLVVAWPLLVPHDWPSEAAWQALQAQGFTRVAGASPSSKGQTWWVVGDRLRVDDASKSRDRLAEAMTSAAARGDGVVLVGDWAAVHSWVVEGGSPPVWHGAHPGLRWVSLAESVCPQCGTPAPAPTPALFSFNHPLGACPTCRGFGDQLTIDWGKVIPDPTRSLAQGAIRPWQRGESAQCQHELEAFARARGVPMDVPWRDLPEAVQRWVIDGDPEWESWEKSWPTHWYGVRRYFEWVEARSYKMAMRALLARYRRAERCPNCRGTRLVAEALAWRIDGYDVAQFRALPVTAARQFWMALPSARWPRGVRLAWEEVAQRLSYLEEVGLGYLTLDRAARTLSGGELQRIRLTTALGVQLTQTLFVLEEPTAGLHARDVDRVIAAMRALTTLGNTVVVIEHDPQVIASSDWVIDLGPGSGEAGGEVVFAGPPAALANRATKTGQALAAWWQRWRGKVASGPKRAAVVPPMGSPADASPHRGEEKPHEASPRFLTALPPLPAVRLTVSQRHNLRHLSVALPLTGLTVIAGVSGSGKSTLVDEVLVAAATAALAGDPLPEGIALDWLPEGDPPVAQVVWVDQTPLARSARSVPVTVLGLWEQFRRAFARTPEAKKRGINAAAFSFNSGSGRCPACQGAGLTRIEMQFLADVYLRCPVCDGSRFRREVREVTWLGAGVAEWLAMTVSAACARLASDPLGRKIAERLAILEALGLGYLRLGQPTPTLSGGEAQRLKLAAALSEARQEQGRRLIILDEPTTGLHESEVVQLMAFLRAQVAAGDAVVVVEHHRDVIASADWVIELGPEGGDAGGQVVYAGPAAGLAQAQTATGRLMAEAPAPLPRAAEPVVRYGGIIANVSEMVGEKSAVRLAPPGAIAVVGAREHNLKGIDVTIPHGRFSVITGRSGSGKSTLAFDILFAEGQRRYLLALDAFARQFVQPPPPPQVERLTGLPPTAAIEQRTSRGGWKSTVATLAELSPYLRLLWTKLGLPHCPACGTAATQRSAEEWAAALWQTGQPPEVVCAALVRRRKGVYQELADWAAARGYTTLFVDGVEVPTHPWPRPDRFREHEIDLPVVRLPQSEWELAQAIAQAWRLADGWAKVGWGGRWQAVSRHAVCPSCGMVLPPLDPRLFSPHSPLGWCPDCFGTGRRLRQRGNAETIEMPRSFGEAAEWEARHVAADEPCPTCAGKRLRPEALAVTVAGLRWEALEAMTIAEVARWFETQAGIWATDPQAAAVTGELMPELQARLALLAELGIDYLRLDRAAPTLSGGEAQRIRLAAQLGSNLTGVAYVLDEPTIGLHPQDDARLVAILKRLRDRGATVIVVEHDPRVIREADWLIDLGPGSGEAGGEVVAAGPPVEVFAHPTSCTAQMMRTGIAHRLGPERPAATQWLTIVGANRHNLRELTVDLPVNRLTVVAGVSGSGKSTLVHEVLVASAMHQQAVGCREVRGFEQIGRVVVVDQSPIGKTSRSCPATYLALFDAIRTLFAATPQARARGYSASFFSFNSGAGRCPVCGGNGWVAAEMAFLPTVREPCEACSGSRYRREALTVTYRGRTIAEVLAMTAEEASTFFAAHPRIAAPLKLMVDVGLGYLRLGQTSATLSGGEAQRLKLVAELAQPAPRPTLFVLDEPTVGLHLADVALLLPVLHRLVDAGHTVVVIEHDPDLWQEADWLIELGPGGGSDGGRLLYAGPVAGLAAADTPSGRVLRAWRLASGTGAEGGAAPLDIIGERTNLENST
jgi:excinuclease ABC subunit A